MKIIKEDEEIRKQTSGSFSNALLAFAYLSLVMPQLYLGATLRRNFLVNDAFQNGSTVIAYLVSFCALRSGKDRLKRIAIIINLVIGFLSGCFRFTFGMTRIL